MENKSGPNRLMIVIVLVIALIAIVILTRSKPATQPDTISLDPDQVPSEVPVYGGDEPIAMDDTTVDTSTWVRVPEDGYEFWHPDYYIRDNGDHYIIAYEPRVGQEFSAIAIFKPIELNDPMQVVQEKVDAMVAGEVATVIAEPKQVSIEGFKSAYLAEYEVNSGPTTGPNKYYLLQSPYTDKWAAIEYAVHPNAEAIRESFRFMPFQ